MKSDLNGCSSCKDFQVFLQNPTRSPHTVEPANSAKYDQIMLEFLKFYFLPNQKILLESKVTTFFESQIFQKIIKNFPENLKHFHWKINEN